MLTCIEIHWQYLPTQILIPQDILNLQAQVPSILNSPLYTVWQAWGRISEAGVDQEASTTVTPDLTHTAALGVFSQVWHDCEEKHGYEVLNREYSAFFEHECSAFADLFRMILKDKAALGLLTQYRPSVYYDPRARTARLGAEVLPFGPIQRTTLEKALHVLSDMGHSLGGATNGGGDPELYAAKLKELLTLSSTYYTLVPQPKPFLVYSQTGKTCTDSWDGKLKDSIASQKGNIIRLLGQYPSCVCLSTMEKLHLANLRIVPERSNEYKEISSYFLNTAFNYKYDGLF